MKNSAVIIIASLLAASATVAEASCKDEPDLLYRCLWKVETSCKATFGCQMDVGSLSCGPFQIKAAYYKDASEKAGYSIGGSWKNCTAGANGYKCSKLVVQKYLERYAKRCNYGNTPTDEVKARVHNGGPLGCRRSATLGYWLKVKRCLETQRRAAVADCAWPRLEACSVDYFLNCLKRFSTNFLKRLNVFPAPRSAETMI